MEWYVHRNQQKANIQSSTSEEKTIMSNDHRQLLLFTIRINSYVYLYYMNCFWVIKPERSFLTLFQWNKSIKIIWMKSTIWHRFKKQRFFFINYCIFRHVKLARSIWKWTTSHYQCFLFANNSCFSYFAVPSIVIIFNLQYMNKFSSSWFSLYFTRITCWPSTHSKCTWRHRQSKSQDNKIQYNWYKTWYLANDCIVFIIQAERESFKSLK